MDAAKIRLRKVVGDIHYDFGIGSFRRVRACLRSILGPETRRQSQMRRRQKGGTSQAPGLGRVGARQGRGSRSPDEPAQICSKAGEGRGGTLTG